MVFHECVTFHLRQRVVVGMGGNSSLEEVMCTSCHCIELRRK